MAPPEIQTKETIIGPASSKQDVSKISKDASSATHNPEWTPAELRELKLTGEQSDRVYKEILVHMDWDLKRPIPKREFQPFPFFCSEQLLAKHAELQKLVLPLKQMPAHQIMGKDVVEEGQAWVFNDEKLADDLQTGVNMQDPKMYLTWAMVTINGKLQPSRVVRPAVSA